MQFLILTLLVAAASATYTYDYSYPSHSYGLDSYGSSLYGGHSYGYGGLGSGVSYLLGGHSASYAPSIHFIRYVPSHTLRVPANGGKINFVMKPLRSEGDQGIKSTQKGSSSHIPPPWISTKGGTFQSKTSDPSTAIVQTKTHRNPTNSPNIKTLSTSKPPTTMITKVPDPVKRPAPKDISVTTDFPDDFSNDTVFIEDDPENEIASRPEPLLDHKPDSSLKDVDYGSKLNKESVSASSDSDRIKSSTSSQTSGKTTQHIDSIRRKTFQEITSPDNNAEAGIATKSAPSKSLVGETPSSNSKTSDRTFVPVPDMDYDDFGTTSKPPSSNENPFKQVSGIALGNQKILSPGFPTIQRQTAYNMRPLTAHLIPQTSPILTPSVIVPEIIMENPVIGYYYENQPAAVTYEYGIPIDVVVTK